MNRRATILGLATKVPEKSLSQDSYPKSVKRLLDLSEPRMKLLERITSGSQIQKRHMAVSGFCEEGDTKDFFQPSKKAPFPKTSSRNEFYKEVAPSLAESVCRGALKQWGGDPRAITHVISVSCTGLIAPGIEFLLIDRLALSPEVERLAINFMGCFGAFKGLSVAKALANESQNHRVLMVCTEICSLHFQTDLKTDTMVANSLFADGAAAVVVGVNPSSEETPLLEIHNQGSTALKGTKELMTWEVGDYGYEMRLSALIPGHLEQQIFPFASRIIGSSHQFDDCMWAVHPGGKAILKAIERACSLQKEQLAASYKVLYDYGNMSSPTFLFVLQEMLKEPCSKKWIIGLGFGPGLSVEGMLLKRVDGYVAG